MLDTPVDVLDTPVDTGGNPDDEDRAGRNTGLVAPLRGHRSSSRWTLDTSRGGSLTGGEGVVPRCLLDWISVALVPGAIVKNWISSVEINIHRQVCRPRNTMYVSQRMYI